VARRAFVFDPPDRFVAGTVGAPGSRTFFLQARDGSRVVSIVLEKTQVAVLAERLGRLLQELEQRGIAEPAEVRAAADVAPLDEPLNEAFRAGTLTLGWDGERETVLIEARAQTEDDDDPEAFEAIEHLEDDPEGPDLFRVRIDANVARSFVERAARIVRSGRPPCPLCGNPLDPQGHLCPRRNGQYVH
jgi:uncharacterized repeat protein (TIGR03847 family)